MVFIDPPYNVPIDGHASGLAYLLWRDPEDVKFGSTITVCGYDARSSEHG
jgi:16S rRNA G966 N2-methylase RsmD